jgi:ABC-type nitrate/sulfonate/bicarbonate transport system substrate-binding protein
MLPFPPNISTRCRVDQGLPLVRIATPLNRLVMPADGPIASTADFKGKTIGSMVGDVESALLKVILNLAVYKNGRNVCQELRR